MSNLSKRSCTVNGVINIVTNADSDEYDPEYDEEP